MGKRRCRGALQNCGASAWYSADRASVVECGARAPLCRGPAEGAAPLPGNRFAVQSRWQRSRGCLRFVAVAVCSLWRQSDPWRLAGGI